MRFVWYGPWLMMLVLIFYEIEDCEESRRSVLSLLMAEPNKKKYGNVNEANVCVRVMSNLVYSQLVICRDYDIDHFQL